MSTSTSVKAAPAARPPPRVAAARIARQIIAGVFLALLFVLAFVKEAQRAWRKRGHHQRHGPHGPARRHVGHVVYQHGLTASTGAKEHSHFQHQHHHHHHEHRNGSAHTDPRASNEAQMAETALAASTTAPRVTSQKDSERVVNRVDYYVVHHGYHYERHRAVTADGFVLYLHRIRTHQVAADNRPARPVVLQHGLFMDPGMFIVNEEESMAFALADEGFDVWLGSNRAVVQEHVQLDPHDDKFWDWSIDELAKYDVPCIVNYVLAHTKQPKLAWVGMSQGNAQAFMAFSDNSALAEKIALFVAIAPVVRIGELPTWLLRRISSFTPELRECVFGRGEFVPLLCMPAPYVPPNLFVYLAYPMFNYLFCWSDSNWKKSRKAKYFQFSPRPQSVKLISHWCEIAQTQRLQRYSGVLNTPGQTYPVETMRCPLALFHGSRDYLADSDALVEHLRACGYDRLRHAETIEGYEHLDVVWAMDVNERVTSKIAHLLHNEPTWST